MAVKLRNPASINALIPILPARLSRSHAPTARVHSPKTRPIDKTDTNTRDDPPNTTLPAHPAAWPPPAPHRPQSDGRNTKISSLFEVQRHAGRLPGGRGVRAARYTLRRAWERRVGRHGEVQAVLESVWRCSGFPFAGVGMRGRGDRYVPAKNAPPRGLPAQHPSAKAAAGGRCRRGT